MNCCELPDLLEHLRRRLAEPPPRSMAPSAAAPRMNYGRHRGPAPRGVRPAAVALLLYPHEGTWRLPLTLRPSYLPDHAGQVCLPGGMREPCERREEAALRELQEELGIDPAGVEILGQLSPTYVFASNFLVWPFVAAAADRPAMQPNPDEVAEVIELPLAALADPACWGVREVRRGDLHFTAPQLIIPPHGIWGVTCMILAELAERIWADGAPWSPPPPGGLRAIA